MARYGMDYGRDYERWERSGRYGGGGAGYGGMRADGWGSNWSDFPGEEGWYGEGYEGYPSGGMGAGMGGYDTSFRGDPRDWGARPGGERFSQGMGGRYGMDYSAGSYGMGYAGRDVGYHTRAIGDRGGWRRNEQRMRAADIMTENPECVTPDTSLADVAKKMRELDVGIIPVVDSMENRRLQGVITDRDIAVRAIAEGSDGKAKVAEFMTTDVEACNKNDRIDQVLEVMRDEQVRRVPITDREGRLVGIIAQADMAVEYAGFDPDRELRVEETIERISEPAQPAYGRMVAQGRQTESQGGRGRPSRKGRE